MAHDPIFGDDAGREDVPDREELIRENARLRDELRRQREENDLLAQMVAQLSEAQQGRGEAGAVVFPLSDEAIELFEQLPEEFTFDQAFERAEQAGIRTEAVAQLLQTYLREEMTVQQAGEGAFVKTGRKPYF